MHIPDGFLSLPVAAATGVVAAGAVGYTCSRLRKTLAPEKVPLLGVAGAFVFAGMMVNFPVAGGTSGHLIGAALVTLLLGPGASILVITAVLVVQCFVFQDGGVSALGANILNMGVLSSLVAYGVYRLLGRAGGWLSRPLVSAGIASWIAVVAAAALCSVELALSGTAAPAVVFPAMLGVHALIGLGEAALTVGALAVVAASRPDLMPGRAAAKPPAEVVS